MHIMKKLSLLVLSGFILSLSSCAVIGGIFKAGVGVGIFLVVLVVAIIIFVIAKVSGSGR